MDPRTMPAGRELDALVAERVMGWKRGDQRKGEAPWKLPERDGVLLQSFIVPRYSASGDAMLEVIEALHRRGLYASLWRNERGHWASVEHFDQVFVEAGGASLPEALCRAALLAVGEAGGGEKQG